MPKFNIDKVSISEITSDLTGETRYLADVNIGIGTQAKLNVKEGIYDNPDFDLSKDSKISAIVIYSKQELDLDEIKQLTGNPEISAGDLSVLKRDTIVEIKKLSQIIRGPDGELLRDLFKDPKAAEENKEDASSFSLFESGGFDFYVDIEYSFSFQRDLDELYEPGEVKNLYVIVVPILYTSKDNKPPKIQKYYNLIREQIIENDIFVGKNEDLRNNFYENLFSFDLSNTSNEVKSMSSDLFPSYGKKKQIKGMFAIDKLNILRNMSDFGGLLDNAGLKDEDLAAIVSASQVLDLKIKRQKIKKLLGFAEREEKISQNFLEETIASSRENPGSNALNQVENKDKQDNLIGEMGELKLNLARGIKFVGFNDFDTSQEGIYRYGLDMSIRDGSRVYIEQRISILIDSIKQLKKYYGQKFLNKSEVSPFLGGNPAERISQVVMVLNNEAASLGEGFKASVKNLLSYQQSTLNLIEFTNDLLKKLQDLPGISIDQINSSRSKSVSKNNTDRLTLYYNTKFNNYVDFTELKNINYDYIGIQENDQIGISVLSNDDTKRRFSFEFFTKLINSDEFDGDFGNLQRKIFGDTFFFSKDPSGTKESRRATEPNAFTVPSEEEYFNLSQTYYSYLSPVGINNNIISNSNVFDADFFNDLHYQQIEDTSTSKNVLLYEIMSTFGISISGVFYNNLYRGLKSVSLAEATSPKVKNYDGKIDNREDFIPLVNTILQKEENWRVSKDNFTTTELKKNFKRYMPNHIRVLFGGKSDVCKNKWLSTEGDYFQNANTYYMMKQNFMNLVEIEALSFGKDSNGNIDLKNSSYRLLRDTDINSGATIICKSQNFQQIDLGVQIDLEKISYPNKYFIIGAGEQSAGVTTSSSTAETGLTVLNTQLDDDLSRDMGINSNEILNNNFVAKDVPESIVNADILKPKP
jgi:hypothetical protein